jgi:CDGSH iron-sulfur domain-containing protein 3
MRMATPKHGTAPLAIDETPGPKAYCTCGWSERLPYCDGAHKRNDTGCVPFKCAVAEAGKKWVCQCQRSGNLPWCDGTHKT